MTVCISEEDLYKLNQLRHRVGFIYELSLNCRDTTFRSQQIAAIFTEISETLDQISEGIRQSNEPSQMSELESASLPADQA